MTDIAGTTALVTGAAMGMGRLIAARLAGEGARLVLVDANAAALDATVAELRAGGHEVDAHVADLSRRERIDELIPNVLARHQVDILVNNAGVVTGGTYDEIQAERDRVMIDLNAAAVHWMTKAFLPGMKQRGRGHIVQLASAAGFLGVPEQVVYCATKWFVIGLSESIRLELAQQGHTGVKMTIVCPSFVATGMFEGVKPPRGTRFLRPEFVVDRIIEAIHKDTLYVREPFIVKTTPALRALLPRRVFDRLADALGVTRSMHGWKGH